MTLIILDLLLQTMLLNKLQASFQIPRHDNFHQIGRIFLQLQFVPPPLPPISKQRIMWKQRRGKGDSFPTNCFLISLVRNLRIFLIRYVFFSERGFVSALQYKISFLFWLRIVFIWNVKGYLILFHSLSRRQTNEFDKINKMGVR